MSYGTIELSPLSADELALVSQADELSKLRLAAAEATHKAAYMADMKAIQQAFEGVCAPVILARQVGEQDSIRFTHDDNGVLCLEIVRRTRVPDLPPTMDEVDALAEAVGAVTVAESERAA